MGRGRRGWPRRGRGAFFTSPTGGGGSDGGTGATEGRERGTSGRPGEADGPEERSRRREPGLAPPRVEARKPEGRREERPTDRSAGGPEHAPRSPPQSPPAIAGYPASRRRRRRRQTMMAGAERRQRPLPPMSCNPCLGKPSLASRCSHALKPSPAPGALAKDYTAYGGRCRRGGRRGLRRRALRSRRQEAKGGTPEEGASGGAWGLREKG